MQPCNRHPLLDRLDFHGDDPGTESSFLQYPQSILESRQSQGNFEKLQFWKSALSYYRQLSFVDLKTSAL
jgi:hypothetical protein